MKHRIPFQSVFYLAIDGEAQLHSIHINSPGNTQFGGPTRPMPGNPPGYMPMPGQMPIPGQMPMPGQMTMPGSYAPGHIPSAGHMPGAPPGTVPPYASGYCAYPGQTHNSPYLQVCY